MITSSVEMAYSYSCLPRIEINPFIKEQGEKFAKNYNKHKATCLENRKNRKKRK